MRGMSQVQSPATRHGAAEASSFKLLDTPEAAAALGIGRRTLQELAAARKIAVIKFGRNVRYDPADLADFAEKNKVRATGWKGGK
jgi:excisionase family DNA binding protein